jgi:hypothetical protein
MFGRKLKAGIRENKRNLSLKALKRSEFRTGTA